MKILSKELMKKSKQQHHLIKNQAGCANKPIEFYKRKLQLIKLQKGVITAFTGVNKSVYSSYVAFYHIAKEKQPHTFGQSC